MQELWIELLVHWMTSGWLAEGLVGGGWCWLGGWLATGARARAQELRHQGQGKVNGLFWEAQNHHLSRDQSTIHQWTKD